MSTAPIKTESFGIFEAGRWEDADLTHIEEIPNRVTRPMPISKKSFQPWNSTSTPEFQTANRNGKPAGLNPPRYVSIGKPANSHHAAKNANHAQNRTHFRLRDITGVAMSWACDSCPESGPACLGRRRRGFSEMACFCLGMKSSILAVQGTCQSSRDSPGTRLNSDVLCVTKVQPLTRAIAAICRS